MGSFFSVNPYLLFLILLFPITYFHHSWTTYCKKPCPSCRKRRLTLTQENLLSYFLRPRFFATKHLEFVLFPLLKRLQPRPICTKRFSLPQESLLEKGGVDIVTGPDAYRDLPRLLGLVGAAGRGESAGAVNVQVMPRVTERRWRRARWDSVKIN